MSREEVKQLLMRVQASYPNWKPQPNIQMVVDVWHEYLEEYDYKVILAGLNAYITTDTSGFAPSVGQVLQKLKSYQDRDELNEMQMWDMIRKAAGNGSWHSQEEYKALPPILQKVVGSPQNLKEWASMDMNTFESVVHSNVLRTYRTVRQQEIEAEKIPKKYRLLLDKVLNSNKEIEKADMSAIDKKE